MVTRPRNAEPGTALATPLSSGLAKRRCRITAVQRTPQARAHRQPVATYTGTLRRGRALSLTALLRAQQVTIEVERHPGDVLPAEVGENPRSRRFPHRLPPLGRAHQFVDRGGEGARVSVGIARFRRSPALGLEPDEGPGFPRHDDLGDPADLGPDHGRLARHRLDVDDAEGLVHRRADEDRGVRVEGDDDLLRQHLRNPDHLGRRLALHLVDERRHLLGNRIRVRCTSAEHDLEPGLQVPDGADQMEDSLLPGDAPDEEDDGDLRIDTDLAERRRSLTGAILVRVDSVVDDAHTLWPHSVELLHILLHRLGDGDDAIRILVSGALDPGRRMVRRAQLLDLPRAVRLERVCRQHELRPGERAGEAAGKMCVPRVAVDDVGGLDRAHHGQVAHERVEELRMAWVLRGKAQRRGHALDAKIAARLALLSERKHLNGMGAALGRGQLASQILDVDPGPAIDVRGILVREHCDAHGPTSSSTPAARSIETTYSQLEAIPKYDESLRWLVHRVTLAERLHEHEPRRSRTVASKLILSLMGALALSVAGSPLARAESTSSDDGAASQTNDSQTKASKKGSKKDSLDALERGNPHSVDFRNREIS